MTAEIVNDGKFGFGTKVFGGPKQADAFGPRLMSQEEMSLRDLLLAELIRPAPPKPSSPTASNNEAGPQNSETEPSNTGSD